MGSTEKQDEFSNGLSQAMPAALQRDQHSVLQERNGSRKGRKSAISPVAISRSTSCVPEANSQNFLSRQGKRKSLADRRNLVSSHQTQTPAIVVRASKSCTKECEVMRPNHKFSRPTLQASSRSGFFFFMNDLDVENDDSSFPISAQDMNLLSRLDDTAATVDRGVPDSLQSAATDSTVRWGARCDPKVHVNQYSCASSAEDNSVGRCSKAGNVSNETSDITLVNSSPALSTPVSGISPPASTKISPNVDMDNIGEIEVINVSFNKSIKSADDELDINRFPDEEWFSDNQKDAEEQIMSSDTSGCGNLMATLCHVPYDLEKDVTTVPQVSPQPTHSESTDTDISDVDFYARHAEPDIIDRTHSTPLPEEIQEAIINAVITGELSDVEFSDEDEISSRYSKRAKAKRKRPQKSPTKSPYKSKTPSKNSSRIESKRSSPNGKTKKSFHYEIPKISESETKANKRETCDESCNKTVEKSGDSNSDKIWKSGDSSGRTSEDVQQTKEKPFDVVEKNLTPPENISSTVRELTQQAYCLLETSQFSKSVNDGTFGNGDDHLAFMEAQEDDLSVESEDSNRQTPFVNISNRLPFPMPSYMPFYNQLKNKRFRRKYRSRSRKSKRRGPDGKPLGMMIITQDKHGHSAPEFPKGREYINSWKANENSDHPINNINPYDAFRFKASGRRKKKQGIRKSWRRTRVSSEISIKDVNKGLSDSSADEHANSNIRKVRSDPFNTLKSFEKDTETHKRQKDPKSLTSEVGLLKTLENFCNDPNEINEDDFIDSDREEAIKFKPATEFERSDLIEQSVAVALKESLAEGLKMLDLPTCKLADKSTLTQTQPTGLIRIPRMVHNLPSTLNDARLAEIGSTDIATPSSSTSKWGPKNTDIVYKDMMNDQQEKINKKVVIRRPLKKKGIKQKQNKKQISANANNQLYDNSLKEMTYMELLLPKAEEEDEMDKKSIEHNEFEHTSLPRKHSFQELSSANKFKEEILGESNTEAFLSEEKKVKASEQATQKVEERTEGLLPCDIITMPKDEKRAKAVRFAEGLHYLDSKQSEGGASREEDDDWWYSVNAMLLRANQVGSGNQRSDHRFPRPDSANVVSPLLHNHPSSGSFLSELLKQDLLERREQAKVKDKEMRNKLKKVTPPSTPAAKIKSNQKNVANNALMENGRSSNTPVSNDVVRTKLPTQTRFTYIQTPSEIPLNTLPHIDPRAQLVGRKKSAAVLTIKTSMSEKAQERAYRTHERNKNYRPPSPHYSPPRPEDVIQPKLAKVRYGRPYDNTGAGNQYRKAAVELIRDHVLTRRELPSTSTRVEFPEQNKPMPAKKDGSSNYLLDQHSETFKYFNSPHLHNRKNSAIVEMYPRDDIVNVGYKEVAVDIPSRMSSFPGTSFLKSVYNYNANNLNDSPQTSINHYSTVSRKDNSKNNDSQNSNNNYNNSNNNSIGDDGENDNDNNINTSNGNYPTIERYSLFNSIFCNTNNNSRHFNSDAYSIDCLGKPKTTSKTTNNTSQVEVNQSNKRFSWTLARNNNALVNNENEVNLDDVSENLPVKNQEICPFKIKSLKNQDFDENCNQLEEQVNKYLSKNKIQIVDGRQREDADGELCSLNQIENAYPSKTNKLDFAVKNTDKDKDYLENESHYKASKMSMKSEPFVQENQQSFLNSTENGRRSIVVNKENRNQASKKVKTVNFSRNLVNPESATVRQDEKDTESNLHRTDSCFNSKVYINIPCGETFEDKNTDEISKEEFNNKSFFTEKEESKHKRESCNKKLPTNLDKDYLPHIPPENKPASPDTEQSAKILHTKTKVSEKEETLCKKQLPKKSMTSNVLRENVTKRDNRFRITGGSKVSKVTLSLDSLDDGISSHLSNSRTQSIPSKIALIPEKVHYINGLEVECGHSRAPVTVSSFNPTIRKRDVNSKPISRTDCKEKASLLNSVCISGQKLLPHNKKIAKENLASRKTYTSHFHQMYSSSDESIRSGEIDSSLHTLEKEERNRSMDYSILDLDNSFMGKQKENTENGDVCTDTVSSCAKKLSLRSRSRNTSVEMKKTNKVYIIDDGRCNSRFINLNHSQDSSSRVSDDTIPTSNERRRNNTPNLSYTNSVDDVSIKYPKIIKTEEKIDSILDKKSCPRKNPRKYCKRFNVENKQIRPLNEKAKDAGAVNNICQNKIPNTDLIAERKSKTGVKYYSPTNYEDEKSFETYSDSTNENLTWAFLESDRDDHENGTNKFFGVKFPRLKTAKVHELLDPSSLLTCEGYNKSYLRSLRTSDLFKNVTADNDRLMCCLNAVSRDRCFLPVFRICHEGDISPMVVTCIFCDNKNTDVKDLEQAYSTIPIFYTSSKRGTLEKMFVVGNIARGIYTLEIAEPLTKVNKDKQPNISIPTIKQGRLIRYANRYFDIALKKEYVMLIDTPTNDRDNCLRTLVTIRDKCQKDVSKYMCMICGIQTYESSNCFERSNTPCAQRINHTENNKHAFSENQKQWEIHKGLAVPRPTSSNKYNYYLESQENKAINEPTYRDVELNSKSVEFSDKKNERYCTDTFYGGSSTEVSSFSTLDEDLSKSNNSSLKESHYKPKYASLDLEKYTTTTSQENQGKSTNTTEEDDPRKSTYTSLEENLGKENLLENNKSNSISRPLMPSFSFHKADQLYTSYKKSSTLSEEESTLSETQSCAISCNSGTDSDTVKDKNCADSLSMNLELAHTFHNNQSESKNNPIIDEQNESLSLKDNIHSQPGNRKKQIQDKEVNNNKDAHSGLNENTEINLEKTEKSVKVCDIQTNNSNQTVGMRQNQDKSQLILNSQYQSVQNLQESLQKAEACSQNILYDIESVENYNKASAFFGNSREQENKETKYQNMFYRLQDNKMKLKHNPIVPPPFPKNLLKSPTCKPGELRSSGKSRGGKKRKHARVMSRASVVSDDQPQEEWRRILRNSKTREPYIASPVITSVTLSGSATSEESFTSSEDDEEEEESEEEGETTPKSITDIIRRILPNKEMIERAKAIEVEKEQEELRENIDFCRKNNLEEYPFKTSMPDSLRGYVGANVSDRWKTDEFLGPAGGSLKLKMNLSISSKLRKKSLDHYKFLIGKLRASKTYKKRYSTGSSFHDRKNSEIRKARPNLFSF